MAKKHLGLLVLALAGEWRTGDCGGCGFGKMRFSFSNLVSVFYFTFLVD